MGSSVTKEEMKNISEEHEYKQNVRMWHLNEFEDNHESELLKILSLKCGILVLNLSLTQLTADQLSKVLSVLQELLFDEWVSVLPSLSTLQHAQVFITEVCALSVDISEGPSQQMISNCVQSLVDSISQSPYI